MNKTLVFHFYTFDGFLKNRAINIHLKCLKQYHNVFNRALFVISTDDLSNHELIHETEEEILNCGFENIQFIVKQNNEFREAQTFYDEVILNLDIFDGIVFFAHTKGISNYAQFPNNAEDLDAWIYGLYYLNLNFIDETENFFNGIIPKMFYGAFLHVDINEVNWKKVPGYYQGAIYWLMPSTILEELKRGRLPMEKVYPKLENRIGAENYPMSLCYWRDNGEYKLGSHNLMATYLHNPYMEGKKIASFLCGDKYKDFLALLYK